jgi:nitrate reductase assembly molybdenum cofactor insertion protein NarJ
MRKVRGQETVDRSENYWALGFEFDAAAVPDSQPRTGR